MASPLEALSPERSVQTGNPARLKTPPHRSIVVSIRDPLLAGFRKFLGEDCEAAFIPPNTLRRLIRTFVQSGCIDGVILVGRHADQQTDDLIAEMTALGLPWLLVLETPPPGGSPQRLEEVAVLAHHSDAQIKSRLHEFMASLDGREGIRAPVIAEALPESIWFRVHSIDRKILLDDIVSASANRDYVTLEMEHTSLMVRSTISGLEKKLDPAKFMRVHRSHIVALSRIAQVRSLGSKNHEIRLVTGNVIPIGRTYWPRLKEPLRALTERGPAGCLAQDRSRFSS